MKPTIPNVKTFQNVDCSCVSFRIPLYPFVTNISRLNDIGEGGAMVLNATFNNISAISWRSVLLVEVTGVAGENHRPAASH